MNTAEIKRLMPVDGVYKKDRVSVFKQVAEELNIPLRILAEEGGTYTNHFGNSIRIPNGTVSVSIGTGYEDLGDFWKKVNEISPLPKIR